MANPVHQGAWHLAGNSDTIYQPVRSNNFEVYFDFTDIYDNFKTPGGTESNNWQALTNHGTAMNADTARNYVQFSVVSFKPPHFSQENVEIKKGNSSVYFASTAKWGTNELVINDYIGADGKSILEAWQHCSYNVTDDTIPDASNYKVPGFIFEYSPSGQLLRSWELRGCWISALSESGAYSNESGGKNTVSATITYDRAFPKTESF